MKIRTGKPFLFLVLVVFVWGVVGCDMSPEGKRDKHFKKGVRFYDQGKYPEALIEFKNAIQSIPNDPQGHYRIGLTYLRMGRPQDLRSGFQEMSKAVELDPVLLEAHVRIGELYLLARDYSKAKEKATLVLAKLSDGNEKKDLDVEARILLGNSLTGLKRFDEALNEYRKALALAPKRIPSYLSLAGHYLVRKDYPAAEKVYQEALAVDSRSTEVTVALGNLYRMQGRGVEAENAYRRGLELKPQDVPLMHLLANFYASQKRFDEAEVQFRRATQVDPKETNPWITLGDFYLLRGMREKAVEAYQKADKAAPGVLTAKKRLAGFYLGEKNYEAAEKTVDAILKKNPRDLETILFKGRIALVRKKSSEAMTIFQNVVREEPDLPQGYYYLGLAHLQSRDLLLAKKEMSEALRLAPGFSGAKEGLAEIAIMLRDFDEAVDWARKGLAETPRETKLYLLLGDAYFGKRNPGQAVEAYQKAVALTPRDPVGYSRLGTAYRVLKNDREALNAFEKALVLKPDSGEALGQIMSVHIARGETDRAIGRAETQLKVSPNNPIFFNLMGKAYFLKKEEGRAEEYFKKSIAADRNLLASYVDLGTLYARMRNFDQAVHQYEAALKVDPNSLSVLMILGMIHDNQKKFDQAKAYYERALKVDPKFAPAANNLAWHYAEYGGNMDVALSLAQIAREQLPEDPGVADTLGWIYYKKNVYLKAVGLLQESVRKMENNPVVSYHLGMAYYKSGDKIQARKALETAVRLSKDFEGANEARAVLRKL